MWCIIYDGERNGHPMPNIILTGNDDIKSFPTYEQAHKFLDMLNTKKPWNYRVVPVREGKIVVRKWLINKEKMGIKDPTGHQEERMKEASRRRRPAEMRYHARSKRK